MKERSVRKNLEVLLVLVMLFSMSFGSIISAQGTNPGNMFSNSGEKVDVLVGFHGPPNRGLVERFGGDVYREFSIVNAIAVSLPQQAVGALARNPAVSYVEPDGLVYATSQTVPWGIERVFGKETYSFDTWKTSKGSGIGVAVLDTGIDTNHPDLSVVEGRRFYMVTTGPPGQRGLRDDNNYNDVHGHGSHVAGTIAALDNETGVVGAAPEVNLYAVKVLGDDGSGHISAIVGGIEWAVEKDIPIINMSFGSSSHSQTLKDACDIAYYEKGHLLVSSAGNRGNSEGTGDNVGYPANYSSVIAVAASDNSDQRASFSSTGPAVELIAPGVGVLSTVPGGYASYNGTSMASPHVAGVAALVWAADSGLSNVEVRDLLKNSAENLGLLENHQGYGMVRADLAVNKDPDNGQPTYFKVTASAGEGGTIDPEGEINVEEGTSQTFSISANEGYVISDVKVDGSSVGAGDSYTFNNVQQDHTIDAFFVQTGGNQGTKIEVAVSTDKSEYTWNSWVNITARVTYPDLNNIAVEGAMVTLTVYDANGKLAGSYEGITNADGTLTASYRVANRAPTGTYNVKAEAFKGDSPKVESTVSFEVKSR